jgi:cellulose synthase/poly-beta-1,6-N-acetylglucosamine synthase-like glycosyltransferase
MMTYWIALAVSGLVAITWLILAVVITRGHRSIPHLSAIPANRQEWPKVSILVPARNEEKHLEAALRSMR